MNSNLTKLPLARSLGGPPHKIVVLRALHLGDLLCAVPAFRALRLSFPLAEISLMGLPWAEAFAARYYHLIDRFVPFPGFPGIPEQPLDACEFAPALSRLVDEKFDLAIQLHGSGSHVNELVHLLGARACCGYYLPGEWCPDPGLFMAYPERCSEITRHLHLLHFLGIPPHGEHLEFPVNDADRAAACHLFDEIDGPYAIVHVGAKSASRWPLVNFSRTADALYDEGLRIVLTGSAHERHLVDEVRREMRAPAIDVSGRTDLGALGALLERSELLVCHDTGVSHVGAALGIPSVIIYNGFDLEPWAPLDRQLHRLLCKVDGVTPEDVIAEARSLLDDALPLRRRAERERIAFASSDGALAHGIL